MLWSDRFYDLSLRILMAAVTLVLLGCVVFLIYRAIRPAAAENNEVNLVSSEVPAKLENDADSNQVAPPQVLLSPGQIFRCQQNGRVSFSDYPCPAGSKELKNR